MQNTKLRPKKQEVSIFFASCPRGLEELLEKEIYAQSVQETFLKNGGVLFKSSYIKALQVLLTSRIASRVYEQITHFNINKEKDLYFQGVKLSWHKVFRVEQTFRINTLLDRDASDRFKNSLVLSQIFKDAIVDQFKSLNIGRPNVDTKNAEISLLVRIETNHDRDFTANVLIDMAGEPLSNRGYRRGRFEAPLRENLAAGIILHSEWRPDLETFVDSMCGSGTLLIEAALIKADIAPSYLKLINYAEKKMRPWDFLKHNKFLEDIRLQVEFKNLASQLYNDALNKIIKLKNFKLYGFDKEASAISITQNNIRNSRLPESLFELKTADATTISPSSGIPGIIICNPPYGERMSEDDETLIKLYHDYGENLKKNWKNYKAFIFTGKPELRKNISLQTSKRIQLYNGNIECRLFRYNLF